MPPRQLNEYSCKANKNIAMLPGSAFVFDFEPWLITPPRERHSGTIKMIEPREKKRRESTPRDCVDPRLPPLISLPESTFEVAINRQLNSWRQWIPDDHIH